MISSYRDRVSVVVCAYTQDRWLELNQSLRSVQAQTMPPNEIILVIDHNPALLALSRQHFPEITVIENQESQGLSGARNSGITRASGKIIAFIDEDAIAAPDWIECLLGEYQNPQVVGVGGEITPIWPATEPDWLPKEFYWVIGCSYKGLPTRTEAVRNLIGCNMSFRREMFTLAGGFRPGIGRIGTVPLGCEETELCIRARQGHAGSILLYKPDAKVYHRVTESRLRWSYFLRRCFAEGLSKARVTRLVGAGDGLSSERHYIFKTLLHGLATRLARPCMQGRLARVKQAAAMIAGLFLTGTGYFYGLAQVARSRNSQPEAVVILERPNLNIRFSGFHHDK